MEALLPSRQEENIAKVEIDGAVLVDRIAAWRGFALACSLLAGLKRVS